eukprot:2189035-Amphidinium_carterae.1
MTPFLCNGVCAVAWEGTLLWRSSEAQGKEHKTGGSWLGQVLLHRLEDVRFVGLLAGEAFGWNERWDR